MYVEDKNKQCVENKALIALRQYQFGKCYYGKKESEYDYWGSFDYNSYNFHLVPRIENRSIEVMGVWKYIKAKMNIQRGGYGRKYASGHLYVTKDVQGYTYLLEFQTLYLEKTEINCILDKIQFMRFRANYEGPNIGSDKEFEMTYPSKEKGYFENVETGHVVWNTNIVISKKSIEEQAENILEKFEQFIGLFSSALNISNEYIKYRDEVCSN